MFQSLASAVFPGVIAQAVADSGDLSDAGVVLSLFVCVGALAAVLVYCLKPEPPEAPRSQHKLGANRARSSEPPASSRPRSIVLYDVTPGQTPYEYNIGDTAGTRGASQGWSRAR